MKSEARQLKTTLLAALIFLTVSIAAHGQSFPLLSATNTRPTNASAARAGISSDTVPLIEFEDVPLTMALKNLARQAAINYILDPQSGYEVQDSMGEIKKEPTLSLRWVNVTAEYALMAICTNYGLTMTKDPATSVVFIRDKGHKVHFVPPYFYWNDTDAVPLIEFEGVPIMNGLENLARQAGINYLLDPQIGYNQPDQDGQIRPEPVVSLRWENITAEQAFFTVCEDYDLDLAKGPANDVILIGNKNHEVHFVPPDFYGNDTNVIPLMKFEDVPLSRALKTLAKQTGFKFIFSPRLDPWPPDSKEPQISFRWENLTASQALAALCENYNLNVIKYPVSGVIRIEPAD